MISVQFSSGQSLDGSAVILFQSFPREALVNSSGMGMGCSLSDVVHPAFPLRTTASSGLQGAVKDGVGEAVVARDMPEPCWFLSDATHPVCVVRQSRLRATIL